MPTLKIYHQLPAAVQEVLLSSYGWLQYRRRYGARDYAAELPDYRKLSSAQLVKLQNDRLRCLIGHAALHVPYYRRLFRKKGLSPDQVNVENLAEVVPVLDKATVASAPGDFYSEQWLRRGQWLHTSGTSGTPLPVLASPSARKANYAFYRSLLNSFDVDVKEKSVTFAGRLIVPREASGRWWRRDLSTRTLYCSSYHLSEKTIPAFIEVMERWGPAYIDSYPSAIGAIASFIVRNGMSTRLRPKVVMVSSETLTEQQRLDIETAFGCPVVDQYGCTEMAVWAWSTGGAFKVEPLYSLVELEGLGADTYSLICTGLLNEAMPLVRYRIGDSVSCTTSCGASLPLEFNKVEGRVDDLIITPEGFHIGRLDPAFKGVEGVEKAQIIQTGEADVTVKVVYMASANRELTQRILLNNLRARIGGAMRIHFDAVESIPVGASGKFKSVVSLLNGKARSER